MLLLVMAYRLLREFRHAFTRLDTPPCSIRHHPGSAIALGFGSCGLQRSAGLAEAGLAGEFQAIYVLRRAQHSGVGRALMGVMAQSLMENGIHGGALWVLERNKPARSFYEVLGGMVVAHREDRRGEDTVFVEVAYGWANLITVAKIAL